MTARALYFHGFASSARSQKVEALSKLLEPDVILDAPDMNVPSFERLEFDAMVTFALDRARANPPDAIVGSSLGSLIALEIVRRGVHAPLVLIAPGVGIKKRWTSRIADGDPVSVFNHALNGPALIHRAFFEHMNEVSPESQPPAVPVTVIMGTNDETIPFAIVRDVWQDWEQSGRLREGSRFIEIENGDHGLVGHVDTIAREIRAAVSMHEVKPH